MRECLVPLKSSCFLPGLAGWHRTQISQLGKRWHNVFVILSQGISCFSIFNNGPLRKIQFPTIEQQKHRLLSIRAATHCDGQFISQGTGFDFYITVPTVKARENVGSTIM